VSSHQLLSNALVSLREAHSFHLNGFLIPGKRHLWHGARPSERSSDATRPRLVSTPGTEISCVNTIIRSQREPPKHRCTPHPRVVLVRQTYPKVTKRSTLRAFSRDKIELVTSGLKSLRFTIRRCLSLKPRYCGEDGCQALSLISQWVLWTPQKIKKLK